MHNTVTGEDGQPRCSWCMATPDYLDYHDREWGFPVTDDRRLFEKLSLEAFQSGLSWRTILAKRENFRSAFCHFDFDKVATFDDSDVARLLADAGIVRHRGKIEAVINNAQRACDMVAHEGSIAAFVWRFEPAQPLPPQSASTSAEAVAMSRELKKRGWKFVGPTTAYAFMQAAGLVNDHLDGCVIRAKVTEARRLLSHPVSGKSAA
ncbi:DNA-3-methyladenine glycosylase I [Mariprofundus erugo]|uniref:DNA-3-methyladenine glycosylase I n=1 Tax=Mariprofundus erugo TaxID=2528639 RepID=UPI0010FE4DEB|nr:DNA-3-methyladenine glycosylase I [Mariprofundus erugo]TLS75300.1 DNA-3-methyladenine glycosylase I [Mariprofundus erugo]